MSPPDLSLAFFTRKGVGLALLGIFLCQVQLSAQLQLPTNFDTKISYQKLVESTHVFDGHMVSYQIDFNDMQPWSETIAEEKYFFCDTPAPHVLTTVVGQTGLAPTYLTGNYIYWHDSIATTVYDKDFNVVGYEAYTDVYRDTYNSSTQLRFFRFGTPSMERLASIAGDALSYSFDNNGILEITTDRQTYVYDKERLRFVKILRDSTGQQIYKVLKRYRRVLDINPTYSGDPDDVVLDYTREERVTTTVSGLCATEVRTTTYMDYVISVSNCKQLNGRSSTSDMHLSPNPVQDELVIVLPSIGPYEIYLTSIDGRVLVAKSHVVGEVTLDVTDFLQGTYFLNASSIDGNNFTSKFVKL